ncbi:arylsulfotransferase family protein [Yinghuangia seranimata]|uniref:arylsulfotransferase family protein n=1 Tax=Yinghuangia seranimata TaxID=408067 RepID=UPI00248C39DB|nr:arylsulfotransferase family protein [Yinghuangia seranimata]MDI2128080.1 arylsulfotransferase family protein [Yinghuangia seranimata]
MTAFLKRTVAAACAAASVSFVLPALTSPAYASPVTVTAAPGVPAVFAPAVVPAAVPAAAAAGYVSRPDLPRFHADTTTPGRPHDGALFTSFTGQSAGGNVPAMVVYDNTGEPLGIQSGGTGARPVRYAWGEGMAAFTAPNRWDIYDDWGHKAASIPVDSVAPHTGASIAVNVSGEIAVVSGTQEVTADLRPYGGPENGRVLVATVKSVAVRTGEVLWEWRSLTAGQESLPDQGPIPLSDSYRTASTRTFDYLGLSSVAYSRDGRYVYVSARGTSAVYQLDAATGQIVATLGGKHPTLTGPADMPTPNKPFSVAVHDDGAVYVGDVNPGTGTARGLVYKTGTDGSVRLLKSVAPDSAPQVTDTTKGAFQPVSYAVSFGGTYAGLLSAGNWSAEYDVNGQLVFTATTPQGASPTTRGMWPSSAWKTRPDVGALPSESGGTDVYASWNGTDVQAWRVSVGPDADHLRVVATTPRAGFETRIGASYTSSDVVTRVEALGRSGEVLGRTDRVALAQVAQAYAAAGGSEKLGAFVSRTESDGEVSVSYMHGTVTWRPATGAHAVAGVIWDYLARGNSLGAPVSDEYTPAGSTTPRQDFDRGTVYALPAGAVTMAGPWLTRYRELGGEQGPLGLPAADVSSVRVPGGDMYVQKFQNGAITGTYVNSTQELHGIWGDIYTKWNAAGGVTGPLGMPLMEENTTSDGGRYVHFSNYWSIFWSPATGAHTVDADVRTKWAELGWQGGFLGYPVTDSTASAGGRVVHFQRGTVAWSPATGAHEVHGGIRDVWMANGAERGGLGFPLADELGAADGVGRYNHFSGGASIFWSPATGAHIVQRGIRDKWAALGWQGGVLGYPTSDEQSTPAGTGRFNTFERGSIYWTSWGGTAAVRGGMLSTWASLGYENSRLGYPRSDEYRTDDGRQRQDFDGGWIFWDPRSQKTTVHYY